MRVATYAPPGLIENLSIAMFPIPEPANEHQCIVKVAYSALNRADILQRRGMYPPPKEIGDILGLEAVGIIHQESNSSSSSTTTTKKFRKNDRVMALVAAGGQADFICVDERNLIRVPDSMSLRTASAITEQWLTAFQLLYWVSTTISSSSAEEIKKKRYLIHAGASGVGTSLIQLLKRVVGVEQVFATCGGLKKKTFLEKELGVTQAFDRNDETESRFDEQISEITNKSGMDVVIDCVGGSYWQKNVASLAMDGEWILYGLMGGPDIKGPLLGQLLAKRVQLKASTLKSRSVEYKQKLMADFEKKILKHFANDGTLRTIIDREFDLAEIASAHRHMESNESIGKIIVRVNGEIDVVDNEKTNEKKEEL
jgi:tumor protein p53-inducible protein 3